MGTGKPPDNVSGAYPLCANKYIQFGSSGFTGAYTDKSDMEIRTNLKQIDCAIVTIDDTYGGSSATDYSSVAHIHKMGIERVVSSGAVKIVRSTQATAIGAGSPTYSYILIGSVDSTD